MKGIAVNNNHYLSEVVLLRPLAILLLIAYHSFICYNGGWVQFEGFETIELYAWIARVNEFIPALFVFLSGYVFSYQKNDLGYYKSFGELFRKKFTRLLVPSVSFSLLYLLILMPEKYNANIEVYLGVLSGIGHLWFLPMLFWCFVIGPYLLFMGKIVGNIGIITILLIVSAFGWIGAALHLPFGLSRIMCFLLYFIMGYLLYLNKERIKKSLMRRQRDFRVILTCCCGLLVIFFLVKNLWVDDICTDGLSIMNKICLYSLKYLVRTLVYTTQVLIIYMLTLKWQDENPGWEPSNRIILANVLCYGIFIYHQFFLQGLYYHTSLSKISGPYLLPWIGFIISILLSYGLSYLTHRTKIGSQYIG